MPDRRTAVRAQIFAALLDGVGLHAGGIGFPIVSALCALISPYDHATIDRVPPGELVGLTWAAAREVVGVD